MGRLQWHQEAFFLPQGTAPAEVYGSSGPAGCDLLGAWENTAQVAPGNPLPPARHNPGCGFMTLMTRCDPAGVWENTAQVAPGNPLPPAGHSPGCGFMTLMTRCDLLGAWENTAQVAPGNPLPPAGHSPGCGFMTLMTRCDPTGAWENTAQVAPGEPSSSPGEPSSSRRVQSVFFLHLMTDGIVFSQWFSLIYDFCDSL